MNVTINMAIEEIAELQTALKEGGFLHECLNMAIGALETIRDGNFQVNPANVSRETLVTMSEYDCKAKDCTICPYNIHANNRCMRLKAKSILEAERNIKEVEEWIKQNSMN